MKMAVFFMALNCFSLIMWCVSLFSGACMDRKSALAQLDEARDRLHADAVISSSARNGSYAST